MIKVIKKTSFSLGILALVATTTYAEQHTYTFNIHTNDKDSKKSISKNINNIKVNNSIKVDERLDKISSKEEIQVAKVIPVADTRKLIKPRKLTKVEKYNLNNNVSKYDSLNSAIEDLAQRLLNSSRIEHNYLEEIAVTSFVDLHKFSKTSHFGRTLSESIFDELFTRGFNVTDFRGQENLTINEYGEYFLTRDKNLLNKDVQNKYILVGTYTKFEDSILISARIINNPSGKIVASARSYYNTNNCKLLENCPKPRKIRIVSHDDYIARKVANIPVNNNIKKNVPAYAMYKKNRMKKQNYSSKQTHEISLIN